MGLGVNLHSSHLRNALAGSHPHSVERTSPVVFGDNIQATMHISLGNGTYTGLRGGGLEVPPACSLCPVCGARVTARKDARRAELLRFFAEEELLKARSEIKALRAAAGAAPAPPAVSGAFGGVKSPHRGRGPTTPLTACRLTGGPGVNDLSPLHHTTCASAA